MPGLADVRVQINWSLISAKNDLIPGIASTQPNLHDMKKHEMEPDMSNLVIF